MGLYRRSILGAGAAALFGLTLLTACEPVPPRPVWVVTTFADGLDRDVGDGICEVTEGVGNCSLRAAIAEANAAGGGDITMRPGNYDLTVADPDDGDPDLDVTGNVRINWGNRERVVLLSDSHRVIDVHDGARFSAHGITMQSDSTQGDSSAVRVAGSMILGESRIYGGFFNLGEPVGWPALEVTEGASVILSNVEVFGAAGEAAVVNDGNLRALFSSFSGFYTPGLHTGPTGSSTIGASRVSQYEYFIRQMYESAAVPACTGTSPQSLGYNRVPNDSCGLTTPTDFQSIADPWVDAIPVGAMGCGEGYVIDNDSRVRPEDGDFDGTPACDIGPVERGTRLQVSIQYSTTGTVGDCYSATLSTGISGGTGPYTWSVTGLPPGLTLDGNRISGIPEEAGSFPIAVTVRSVDGGGSLDTTMVIQPSSLPPMVEC